MWSDTKIQNKAIFVMIIWIFHKILHQLLHKFFISTTTFHDSLNILIPYGKISTKESTIDDTKWMIEEQTNNSNISLCSLWLIGCIILKTHTHISISFCHCFFLIWYRLEHYPSLKALKHVFQYRTVLLGGKWTC